MSRVTVTGLVELLGALDEMPDKARDDGKEAVEQACRNVERDWKARWSGHPSIRHLPAAIDHDVTVLGEDQIIGEVGVDKAREQGPLGNLIEFGSINNAPIPGGMPALDAEEPGFINDVGDFAERLLDERR